MRAVIFAKQADTLGETSADVSSEEVAVMLQRRNTGHKRLAQDCCICDHEIGSEKQSQPPATVSRPRQSKGLCTAAP